MIHQVVGEGVTGTLGIVGVVVTVETVTGEVAMVTASEEIGIVKVVIVTMSVQARKVIIMATTYLCVSLRRRKSIHYHNSRNREPLIFLQARQSQDSDVSSIEQSTFRQRL